MTADQAKAFAANREGELLGLLEALVNAPSPFGARGDDAQAIVAEYLEQQGFEPRPITVDPRSYTGHVEFTAPGNDSPALNLICSPRDGHTAREVLFAHIDTSEIRAGIPRAEVRGNRMYGLGAADNKAGVAACAVAAAILRGGGYPAPTMLSVHAKGGGARGTLALIESLRDIDAALYVHPAETGRGLDEIKHVSRGVLDVKLRVYGWVGRETELGNGETVPFHQRGNAIAACMAVIERWRDTVPRGCVLNVGAVEGGDHPGKTPRDATARVRLVFEETLTTNQVFDWADREAALVIRTLPRGAAGEECRAIVTVEGIRANPASTAVDSAWYRAVHSAVAAVTGRPPEPYDGHLCSDIRFPTRLLGVPCVGIGPYAGNFHKAEEWVDIRDLTRTVAAVVLAVGSFKEEQSCRHIS